VTEDDVAWARAVLGPANPVPTGGPVPTGHPLVPAVAAPQDAAPGRARRRAVTVGALASAAALVIAVTVTTALGGGSAHRAPGGTRAVFAAAATTEAAKTADISVSATTAAGSLSGQGVADLATGDADFTVDLPASLGQVEVRSARGTVYVHVPSALAPFSGGKPWASISAPAAGSTAPASFDATWLMAWLRNIAGPVTTVSTTEAVHGDPTTHYRASVDLAKVAANAPGSVQPYTGPSMPVDVWVDAAGRLRRLTASFDGANTPAARLGTVRVSVELWRFGTPVQVTAPPADQVGDATGLLPAARQLLPGLAGA
jgi:hypothetical protein